MESKQGQCCKGHSCSLEHETSKRGKAKNELEATRTSSFALRSTTNTLKNARMVELLWKHSSRKSSRCLARSVLRRLARIHREAIDILSSVKGSNLQKFAVLVRLVCALHLERERSLAHQNNEEGLRMDTDTLARRNLDRFLLGKCSQALQHLKIIRTSPSDSVN